MNTRRRFLLLASWCLVAPRIVLADPTAPVASAGPLAAEVRPFVERHELAGAVMLVTDKERTLAVETVGFADVAGQRAMAPDSLFWIASQTKAITATAVMMLVDEGKVKLDDPIEKYLPEFKGQMVIAEQDADHVLLKKPAHPPTIRETLAHTSGMPFRTLAEDPSLDLLPLRQAVRTYAMAPLQFEPGSKYLYSNCGINAAARVIEVVTKQSYEDFMRTRLFEPLGMKDTTFHPTAEQLKRLAKSYQPNAAKDNLAEHVTGFLYYPLDDPQREPMPAGGLFSTAADVAQFCRMILNGGELNGRRYLSAEAVKEMGTRQTGKELKESYGLGWAVSADSFGHGGALSTNMTIYPGRGVATVWLVQHAGFPGQGGKAQGAFNQAAAKLATPK